MGRRLGLFSIGLIVLSSMLQPAYASRCTEDEIQKMINAGFSNSKVKELCGVTDKDGSQKPPSDEKMSFSGTWMVQLETTTAYHIDAEGRSEISESLTLARQLEEEVARWLIDFQGNDRLSIYSLFRSKKFDEEHEERVDLKPTNIVVDGNKISFQTSDTYQSGNDYSEITTQYHIELKTPNRMEGEWSKKTESINHVFKEEGTLRMMRVQVDKNP